MNRKTLQKLTALLLALCVVFTLTACHRGAGDENGLRMDITVDYAHSRPSRDDDQYVDISAFVPRPERRLPFQPSETVVEISDPNIKMIEINQCLSYGYDTSNGEFYLMQNFVAGKETAVFVTFNEPLDPSANAVLTIERDGAVVAQLPPVAIPDEYTILFQPKEIGDVGNWAAGSYSFKFETDGGWAVRTANFFDSTTLKILGVPVIGNYGGSVYQCTGIWRDSLEYLIAAFPVARADVEYVLAPELDLSDSRYDLLTDNGCTEVWRALTYLQTPNEDYTLIIGFVPEPPWFPSINSFVNGYTCGLPGNVIYEGNPEMVATIAHEVSHCYNVGDEYETGGLNLDVNVPPYGMSGRRLWSRSPVTADNPLVIGGPRMGLVGPASVIYAEQRPYYVAGSNLLGATTCFMGSGMDTDPYTRWVSSEIYNHIFEIFTGHSSTASADDVFTTGLEGPEPEYWGQCPNCYMSVYDPRFYVECWQCLEFVQVTGNEFQCSECDAYWFLEDYEDDLYLECSDCKYFIWYDSFIEHNSGGDYEPREEPQGTFTQITGYVTEDNIFTADPWFTYETNRNVITPDTQAEYRVYVYGADGTLLSAADFNAERQVNASLAFDQVLVDAQRHPVNAAVRLPDGAARFVIRCGEEIIFSRDVSQNAPTVAFTGLSNGQQLSDALTLTWEANDADGDELYFNIWYYPKEGQCYNIAANVTGRSIDVDLSALPGTNDGFFRIYTTDGVWTAEADSPSVRVPYKAPIIYSEQDSIPELKLTEAIWFDPCIYDLQDGWMHGGHDDDPESPFRWISEGIVYSKSSRLIAFPFSLAPGLHTFTCTARNSAGLVAEREFSFIIIDDDSDLPDDWSRGDVRQALEWGMILPLDRIDAPVTRSDVARMMNLSYGIIIYLEMQHLNLPLQNPFPEVTDGVVTDSGSVMDNWHETVAVTLGYMGAPGGLFGGSGSITQLEAVTTLFRASALAVQDLGEGIMFMDADDASIIEFMRLLGVFDYDGPNAFNAAERMTNRLMMVWASRYMMGLVTTLVNAGYLSV